MPPMDSVCVERKKGINKKVIATFNDMEFVARAIPSRSLVLLLKLA